MKFIRYCFYSIISTHLLFPSGVYAAAPSYNIQLGITAEDFEGKTETSNKLTGSVRYSQGLSRHSAINVNADLFTRTFSETESRDSNGILGEVIYNYIPSSGYTKPVYSFGLRQEFETFDNSKQDFYKTSFIVADTIRLDDQLTLTAGLELSIKASDVEDITSAAIFLNSDLQLNSKFILYLNLKLQQESIESNTAMMAMAGIPQVANRDDFSGHHTSGETGLPTPNLPSTSNGADTDSDNIILTLGTNYFFSSNQSIDISYEYSQYALSGNVDIDGSQISLDYFYKF